MAKKKLSDVNTVAQISDNDFITCIMQSSGEVVKVKRSDLFPLASSTTNGLMPSGIARRYDNFAYIGGAVSNTNTYYVSDIQIAHNKCGFLELEVLRYSTYNRFKILISATYNFESEAITALREDIGITTVFDSEIWAKKIANGKWAIYVKFKGGSNVPVSCIRRSSENLLEETSYKNVLVSDTTGLQKVI